MYVQTNKYPDRGYVMTTAKVDVATGLLTGPNIEQSHKILRDLRGVFADETARQNLPQDTVVYRVQAHMVPEAQRPGGLYFGTSIVEPGQVGGEYFMTRGHFHALRDTGEYYWCIDGSGILLLMGEDRKVTTVTMAPGALAYIPGFTAHRLVNTGRAPLVVGACWPSNAGHDYATIDRQGFAVRIFSQDGKPVVREV
jgi:glucose-6-phosphate isomerase